MNLKFWIILLICPLLWMSSCNNSLKVKEKELKVYEENWESLARHEAAPEWFKDAKLGIYFHWGIYSVPAYGDEWYPRWMHFKHRKEYEHHVSTYGTPDKFGYHDFVPMFKAEYFDAKEWADLFKKAGARFAGPVAEHHDGFSMWASKVTPWNVMDKGPHKDITGELKKAITEDGMKFITTFHHAKHLQRYKGMEQEELEKHKDNLAQAFRHSHYPWLAGMPPTSEDPQLKYLYGNIPEDQWLEEVWFGKLKEVIDQYDPDIIWFDSWLDQIPEKYRQKFSAYYLNHAEKENKEVVIVRKQQDLPLNYTVDDLEKSRKNKLGKEVWMTDETLSTGSWCYTENLQIKPTADIVHVLADIVSKNGVLLLNISPMANGTIPEDQKKVLLEMGDWLNEYGEAIYETRPWYTFGEGPTIEPEGNFKNHKEFLKIKYSVKDIRYTTKGKIVYAIILGEPDGNEPIIMNAFSKSKAEQDLKVKKLSLLGTDEVIDWTQEDEKLIIAKGFKSTNKLAQVFKIELTGIGEE